MDRRFSSSFPRGIPLQVLVERFNKIPKPKLIVFDLGRTDVLLISFSAFVKIILNTIRLITSNVKRLAMYVLRVFSKNLVLYRYWSNDR